MGQLFAEHVREMQEEYVTAQIAKCSERHAFKVMLQCWVVECSFAWLEKYLRLRQDCIAIPQYRPVVYPLDLLCLSCLRDFEQVLREEIKFGSNF